jgi:guanylate kinase
MGGSSTDSGRARFHTTDRMRRADPDEPHGRAGGGRPPARLAVLSGPSAVGKSTVVEEIRRNHPEVWLSVSVTTRPPRPGEKHGVQYFFVDDDEFDRLIRAGEFLEWAGYGEHRYGTPRTPVLDHLSAGTPTLLEVDVQGARQVRAAMTDALLIFLAPPSWDELVRRLVGRGTEAPDVVERRLELAGGELAAASEFDITLVNTSVPDVADQLINLLIPQDTS